MVAALTVPPCCRDPCDHPALTAVIDGHADAIVTGNADLPVDDGLRRAMQRNGVALWGVGSLPEDLVNKGS